MNAHFSEERSDGIRAALIDAVSETTRAELSSRRRGWFPMLGMLGVGLLLGGAVSAAALSLAAPNVAIDDPLPGTPEITAIGQLTTLEVSEDRTIPLHVPEGATHVRVTVTCLSAGVTTWGLDPGGNNPSSVCLEEYLDNSTAWFDFALTPDTNALYIEVEGGTVSRVSYLVVVHKETSWGVNESGETFGVPKTDAGEPELVAVMGKDADGNFVQGYARESDLNAFGPLWPDQPSNPEEAIAWQNEKNRLYPNGWDIPVFRSDGTTQIGTFHIGGGG